MNLVDDATGTTLSFMGQEENTDAAMRVLWLWVARYGVPRALYTDRASVYISGKEPSVEEQLRGEESLTRRSGCSPAEPYPPTRQHYADVSFTFWQDDIFNELRQIIV